MYTGFATRPGPASRSASTTWSCRSRRSAILQAAEEEVKDIQDQYSSGLVTNGERYNKVVDIWSRTNDQVAKAMMDKLGTETSTDSSGKKVRCRSRSTRSS
jgi:DNA-directed RNA polymerase subunit beta'